MNITALSVYGFNTSLIASGFPKLVKYSEEDFVDSLNVMSEEREESRHFKRITTLANAPMGSGHMTALSGIVVQFNVTASNVWFLEFLRYHFQQIVSSTSKQHMLRKMMEEGTITFAEKTHPKTIKAFMSLLKDTSVDDETLVLSCPMGMELTARISTNYLQLKSMYHQRKNHKLGEWRDFCTFIETTLPCASELIVGGKNED